MGVVNRIKTSISRTRRTHQTRQTRQITAMCAAAGRAAGVHNRRGSVLVLILGGLAMLSIVAVVYVTVGQNDRRTGATTRARDSVQDTAQGVGDYIARIIGDDATATMVDGTDRQLPNPVDPTQPGPVLVREAHDYPSTDYTLRTHGPALSALAASERFNPAGSYDAVWGGAGADLRTPTDPWLASSEPTWLQGPSGPSAGAPTPGESFTFRIDWAQFSNIAPSGNPVNLYNLRRNFDAEPGFSVNPFTTAAPGPNDRMSDRLWLFDAAGAPTRTTWFGRNLVAADALHPAYWTMGQQSAFRPARDVNFGPEEEEYLHYHYADADGDGMFDSRWFELVDVSDPANPVSVLPKDDRFRWFVAPRVIDLNGRINVNTATDFRTAPTSAAVAGMSPADIDLLRVLRMDDAALQYRLGGVALDYQLVAAELQVTGSLDWVLGQYASSYTGARAATGHFGYEGLRIALRDFAVPPFGAPIQTAPLLFTPFTPVARAEYYRRAGSQGDGASLGSFVAGTPPTTPVFTSGGVFGLADLLELLTHGGLNEPGEPSRMEAAAGGRLGPGLPGGSNATTPLSPLRDNWDPLFDRGRIDDDENALRGDGLADDEALAMRALDPRLLLTSINGARPLVSQVIVTNTANQLDAARELSVDAVAALEAASPPTGATLAADASKLFAAYSDALLPHSWRVDSTTNQSAWNMGGTNRLHTLMYGSDPIVAIWAAAHMTANAIDMYDRDAAAAGGTDKHEPSAFTLALGGTQTELQYIDQNATGLPRLYPYWQPRVPPAPGQPLPARPGTLDLDWATGVTTSNQIPAGAPPSRLARQGDLSGLPVAMNVFGVEAQPFIVEVASITIYTDAPVSAYGANPPQDADEWQPPDPLGGNPVSYPITINGNVTDTNPDIICQVLAFQITNPFDERIGLSDGDAPGGSTTQTGFGAYYIEFGGHFFRLAQVDSTGTTLSPAYLDGRDPTNGTHANTRTYYVLNDTLENIQDRLENADLGVNGYSVPADAARLLIEQQLSTAISGPSAGGDEPPILIPRVNATGQIQTGFVDLFGSNSSEADFKEVRLWRAIGTSGQRDDDLLADRIRDPSSGGTTGTLDRRLASTNQSVIGTDAGQDPTTSGGSIGSALDNTGFSIVMWGSFKRMDDPNGTNSPLGAGMQSLIPRGAIPAYCIEPRLGPVSISWQSVSSFRNQGNPMAPAANGQLRRCDFTGGPCTPQRDNAIGTEALFAPPAAQHTSLVGRLLDGAQPKIVETSVGSGVTPTRSYITMWPEDKGADQIPRNFSNTEYDDLYPEIHLNDDRFTSGTGANTTVTLRVADMLLPLAVGPTWAPVPSAGTGTVAEKDDWLTLGESLAVALNYVDPAASDPAFGFLNGFGGGLGTSPAKSDRGNLVLDDFAPYEDNTPGTQTFVAATDVPRWPGIPLALRVLDLFTTTPRELGSIERGTPGKVNANTAAPRVLQALPMLRPNGGVTVGTLPMWWGQSTAGATNLPTPLNTDVASGLEAYRDKLEVEDSLGGGAPLAATFRELQPLNTDRPANWDGRWSTAQIPALREAPGMASIGELLCVTASATTGGRLPPYARIDGLAADGQNNGAPGVDSIVYSAVGATPASIDGIIDDFDEKLTIASAVTNTVTVRSDVFAVWFVLHGYQRSDVEGLSGTPGRADPLVPTIAKRYLMIVDRSNVTRKGDKPRILMMQELPM